MDVSHDSKLIVTCSADKNVKIWGLDFGDCHKSIFAHDESVMQVAFEKESHYFWTVSKDKLLKYWDGDKVGVLLIGPLTDQSGNLGRLKLLWDTLHSFSSLRKSRPWKGTTVRSGHSP